MTGATVAVKVIPRSYYAKSERARESLKLEVQILQGLEKAGGHPHIVSLLSVFDTGPAIHLGTLPSAGFHSQRPSLPLFRS